MLIDHYLQLLRLYRRTILIIVVTVTLATAALSYLLLFLAPKYTATTSVVMVPTEAEVAFSKGQGGSQDISLQSLVLTHMEFLTSRPVAETTVDKVAEALSASGPSIGLKAALRNAVQTTYGFLFRTYRFLNSGTFVEPNARDLIIGRLMDGIDIQQVEGSYVLEISVTLPNPQAAALAANSLADSYRENVLRQLDESAVELETFLLEQIAVKEEERQNLLKQEFDLRKELGILSIEQEREFLLAARETERENLLDAETQQAQIRAEIEALSGLDDTASRGSVLAEAEEQVLLGGARQRSADEDVRLRTVAISRIDRQLEDLNEKEEPLTNLLFRRQAIESDLDQLRQQILAVGQSRTTAMQQLRDIAPARVPVYPSFPEAVVYTVLAFIASLLISAFVVIAADTAFDSVKTTVDLQRVVGSASLGGIDRSLAGAVAKRQVSSKKLQRRLRNSGKQIDRSLTLAGVPGGGLIEVGGFASSDDARPTAEAVAWALASAGRNVRCVSPPLLRESVDLDLPDALEVVTAAESGAVLTIAARGSGAKGMELASDGPSDNLLVLVEAGGASDSELESTVRQGEQLNGRSPLYLMLLS